MAERTNGAVSHLKELELCFPHCMLQFWLFFCFVISLLARILVRFGLAFEPTAAASSHLSAFRSYFWMLSWAAYSQQRMLQVNIDARRACCAADISSLKQVSATSISPLQGVQTYGESVAASSHAPSESRVLHGVCHSGRGGQTGCAG